MAEDVRELLADAAPRPQDGPDFEQLWERGRRQRQTTRMAGAMAAVVLLAVAGVGLAQMALPGPGGTPLVDAPETLQELRGRGEQFGQDETPGGVPYSGRLRVGESSAEPGGAPGQDEVCVTLRIGGAGQEMTASGCGLLERYLENDSTLSTQSRQPAQSGVAAWTPLEVDHAVWELDDQDLPIEVLKAPGLPGSMFVIAVDGQPEQDTRIVMYDAEGEVVDTISLEADDNVVEDDQVLFELGEASVWTSQPVASLAKAADAFALQALGWETARIDQEAPSGERVTMTGPEGQEIKALFSRDSTRDDIWHILEVGSGTGGLAFEPLALDLGTVPSEADEADVWVGGDGQTRLLDVDSAQLADGRINLDALSFQEPDDIVAALIVYRDADGAVLDASGGHFAPEPAP